MIRIISIVLISFASLVPYLMIFNRWLEVGNGLAGWISMILGWIVTPILLLQLWKVKPSPEVIPVNIDDPIIQELIDRSRSEINRFLSGLEEGKKEAYIKFPFEFSGETEHVWGLAHSIKEGSVITTLDSTPVGEVSEEVLERLSIDLDSIEDWMLLDRSGKTYGGYSILGLAKVYTRDYGKLPKAYTRDLERFVDFSWPENV
jgi:uncharacterized protein YegJ (DUF2314 family)